MIWAHVLFNLLFFYQIKNQFMHFKKLVKLYSNQWQQTMDIQGGSHNKPSNLSFIPHMYDMHGTIIE